MNAGPLLYDEVMELDLGIVYSCPPEEEVPHILAYFQQEFSNPFPAPKPVSHEEELLLEKIDSAFDGVILEDGIGLMTTELIDMYAPRETCDAIGPCEERTDWRRICLLYTSLFHSAHSGSFHLSLAVLVHYRSPTSI